MYVLKLHCEFNLYQREVDNTHYKRHVTYCRIHLSLINRPT